MYVVFLTELISGVSGEEDFGDAGASANDIEAGGGGVDTDALEGEIFGGGVGVVSCGVGDGRLAGTVQTDVAQEDAFLIGGGIGVEADVVSAVGGEGEVGLPGVDGAFGLESRDEHAGHGCRVGCVGNTHAHRLFGVSAVARLHVDCKGVGCFFFEVDRREDQPVIHGDSGAEARFGTFLIEGVAPCAAVAVGIDYRHFFHILAVGYEGERGLERGAEGEFIGEGGFG